MPAVEIPLLLLATLSLLTLVWAVLRRSRKALHSLLWASGAFLSVLVWAQADLSRDRSAMREFLGRAERAGVVGMPTEEALRTLGTPVREERDERRGTMTHLYAPGPWYLLWNSHCKVVSERGVVVGIQGFSD